MRKSRHQTPGRAKWPQRQQDDNLEAEQELPAIGDITLLCRIADRRGWDAEIHQYSNGQVIIDEALGPHRDLNADGSYNLVRSRRFMSRIEAWGRVLQRLDSAHVRAILLAGIGILNRQDADHPAK